jgi:hypothetical protein
MSESRKWLRVAVSALVFSSFSAAAAQAQPSWRDVTTSRLVSGESSVAVEVKYGAGDLRIRSAPAGTLYRMQLRYDEDAFEPVSEYRRGRLRLGVESTNRRIPVGRDRSEGALELELARGVPMDLDLDFGAVRADLDLGGLALTNLELRTGASETRLNVSTPNPSRLRRAEMEVGAADFTARQLGNLNTTDLNISAGVGKVRLELTGDWRENATVNVHMGLGSLELVVPEGLGVRLVRETFLTSLDSEGLVKRGEAYYSTDWETADRRVTVNVNAAFGSIKVLWMR